ncbi:MAG: hypothetical protein N2484_05595 [Clostridia bacterium]|nr:hypothetical protein [Clostridia bacterium]
MKFGLKVFLVIAVVIVIALVVTSIMKSVMKVGQLKTKEFKIAKSSFKDWESVLSHPGSIRVETLQAGEVYGTVHGLINMKNPKAAGIEDKKLSAPLLAHLIHHEKYGDFLIDTGFDSAFIEKTWGNFEGILKKGAFKFRVEKGHEIEKLLADRKVNLKGVFCTHFHEHQGGAPSLSNDIPFIFGKGEAEISLFPIAFSRFLKDKTDLQAIDFNAAGDMPIVGKAVDIFGDGSLWAIATPGHTKGHTSYLVNGSEGPKMFVGDICMFGQSYELGVESGGKFAEDLEANAQSFSKIKKFLDTYKQVKPVFGHESDEFRIKYE